MALEPSGFDRAKIASLLAGRAPGALPGALPGVERPKQYVVQPGVLRGQSGQLRLPLPTRPEPSDGGPGGAFGLALNVLDFGRAGIVSGFKESIDLLQDIKRGELGSGSFHPRSGGIRLLPITGLVI